MILNGVLRLACRKGLVSFLLQLVAFFLHFSSLKVLVGLGLIAR